MEMADFPSARLNVGRGPLLRHYLGEQLHPPGVIHIESANPENSRMSMINAALTDRTDGSKERARIRR